MMKTNTLFYTSNVHMVSDTLNYDKKAYPSLKKYLGYACASVILATLTACSSTSPQQRPIYVNTIPVPQYYTVRSGESLSRIAMRYGLDYRRVAMLNGLDSSYTIHPGQRLRLVAPTSPKYVQPTRTIITTRPIPPTTRPPVTRPPVYNSQPVYQNSPNTRIVTQPVVSNTASQSWLRPVQGNLIKLFNPSSNINGNWYAASPNTPVVATQAGTVMYVGSDLPEYGKLVMIQHNKDFISAYAHLNSFNVQEGQTVRAGQQLGTVGYLPGNNQPIVEFQVRYRGTPVNPATYVK